MPASKLVMSGAQAACYRFMSTAIHLADRGPRQKPLRIVGSAETTGVRRFFATVDAAPR
jgi:hypothetical protein